jgi:AbiV family abortive infection protein
MSLSIQQLDQLIDALSENAFSLIQESELLLTNGYHARAYSLAHFAREELSKCFMLHAAANKLLAGVDVDWKKLMRRFRSHQQKLISEQVQASVLLSAFGNSEKALSSLMAADVMADKRNDDKNASLYVEFSEGKLSTPSAVISEAKAKRTFELASLFLLKLVEMRKTIGVYQNKSNYGLNQSVLDNINEVQSSDPETMISILGRLQAFIIDAQENKDDSA